MLRRESFLVLSPESVKADPILLWKFKNCVVHDAAPFFGTCSTMLLGVSERRKVSIRLIFLLLESRHGSYHFW